LHPLSEDGPLECFPAPPRNPSLVFVRSLPEHRIAERKNPFRNVSVVLHRTECTVRHICLRPLGARLLEITGSSERYAGDKEKSLVKLQLQAHGRLGRQGGLL